MAAMNMHGILRASAWTLFIGLALLGMMLSASFLYLNPQVPPVASFSQVTLKAPLRIYSADGKLIQEFGSRLTPLAYEQIPERFKRAILDTEDKRFWEHAGIDLVSLVNASWQLVRNRGAIKTGASTITMQLVKNVSGETQRTFLRKFREMLLALKVEEALTKEEILTLYLNVIPFGKHAFGIQAAANTYYGKNIDQLNLAQMAMLAGVPQAPAAGNPINGPKRALKRRNLVLLRMLEQNSITLEEYEAAVAAPITASLHGRSSQLSAPYVAEMVRQDIHQRYGADAYHQGMVVRTTIDSRTQAAAQAALRRSLLAYDRRHGYRGPERRKLAGAKDYIPVGKEPCQPAEEGKPGDLETIAAIASVGSTAEELVLTLGEDQCLFAPEDRFPQNWRNVLAEVIPYGGQHPAVVTQVADKSLRVLTKDLEEIDLPWEGIEWARRYLDVNTRGRTPRRAQEVASVGDLVRYQKLAGGGYRLSQHPLIQGALVAMDPETGAIRALVGGFEFRANQFNHATQAKRQPGSIFKPFFYAGAMEDGLTAASVFNDAPLVLPGGETEDAYRPTNSSDDFRGDIRLREALYRSINLVSLRVLLGYGPDKAVDYVSRFGFDTSRFPNDAQLAFGGGTLGLSPLDITAGYTAFANGGYKVEPHFIKEVDSINSDALYQAEHPIVCHELCLGDKPGPERIVDARVAYILNTMLADVVRKGTGKKIWQRLGRSDLHGKTGTTNDAADVWFSGFAPGLVATVWAGFSDNSLLGRGEWGSTVPLEAWVDFMEQVLPPESRANGAQPPRPPGIASVKIDPQTGLRTEPTDPEGIFEIFREERVPEKTLVARETQEAEPVQEIF